MDTELNSSAVLPNRGLTTAQVNQRIDAGLSNVAVEAPTKTVSQIIAGNIFTYFNLVFAALAVVVILVGAWRELLFLPVVAINALIGIVQEIRAKITLDKMTLLSAPRFLVLRDGRDRTVNTADLVKDDLVKFGPGQQIPADAVIIDGEVLVNESLITGEADEILKTPGMGLLSGSYIVSGGCTARLEKVGANSFVSKLTLEAKATRKVVRSEMMKSLSRLVLVIGILIVPVGAGLFLHQWLGLGEELRQSVITTVAALVGMVPEGLYLLTSVALAVSVIRLSKRKTLVHELGCIETLARVNVLCVDKTGTITEPQMLVEELIPLSDLWDAESILADHCLNLGGENDTMKALARQYGNKAARTAQATLPFNSKNKFSAALYDNGECYLLGAPEFILGERMPQTEPYVQRGLRVLLVARAASLDKLDSVEPVALVTLSNKIRKNAAKTFRYFAEQGVEIKVISGDNPQTVSFIAERAGIADADKWVDATTLSDDEIPAAVTKFTVFGRVTPEQKRKL
ncbi:MAG: HAD-IC family P-type ATPase, partial [Oscillospiraceae bacterium]|nr:HAD-IC family P-type ATPase [Oscillospiraceae bacterium]